MTSTRCKVKVTGLLNVRKLHFSRFISSSILVWSSKLMVGNDSMGPGLHLVGAQFSSFLLRQLSVSSNFAECQYYTNFKWPYFRIAWGYSHISSPVGSSTHIVHADVTLTRSKVKVMELLKFRKLHFSGSISFAILMLSSKLMVDHDSMGPIVQRIGAQCSNFLLRKLSHDFKLCGMLTLHAFQMLIFPYCLRRVTWSGMLVVIYVLCMLIWPWPEPRSVSRSLTSEFPKIALFYVYLLRHFGVKLKTDDWLW